MIKGEYFFQTGNITSRSFVETSSDRTPFNWYSKTEFDLQRDKQFPTIIDEVPGSMRYQIVPSVVPRLLSQRDILHKTVTGLFAGQDPHINKVNATLIQAGRKAYIVLCEADTALEKKHFVMYVSRNPKDSILGNETERDYDNLLHLNHEAHLRLSNFAKQKYQVVQPIAYTDSSFIEGHQYGCFTMPFIADYGELRADAIEDLEFGLRYLFFRYAFPYNQIMDDSNRKGEKIALTMRDEYIRLSKKFPRNRVDSMLQNSEARKVTREQLGDLLVGNALIYLLSSGHFPKDFMVNAGDWMAFFRPNNRLNLCLITVRGGWEYVGDDKLWIKKMQEHLEPMPGREMEAKSMLYLLYSYEDVAETALARAKKLLLPK